MTQEDYIGSPFSEMQDEFAGLKEEMDEPGMDIEPADISVEAALMNAAESIVVTLDRDVVVDGEFVFPLDYNWMNMLIWRPVARGERLKGIYQGATFYNWTDDEELPADKYFIVRCGGVDRLIPAWSAVDKGLNILDSDTEVLLIYGGTVKLKNGRTFHRILVGANVKTNNPLVD